MIIKELNPCPKCGGPAVFTMLIEHPYQTDTEIQCVNCGLTLHNVTEYAWTPDGARIALRSDVTWNYRDGASKSAIEVWNNMKGGASHA